MDAAVFEVLERIATALERSAEIAEKDYEFRMKCQQEQADLVARMLPTNTPAAQVEGRRARRG